MKRLFTLIALMICLLLPPAFAGCDVFGGGSNDGPIVNNATDLVVVTEGSTDDSGNVVVPTQYKSKKLNLVTEINGSYKLGRPFVLDPQDENKRIYDDIYLYVDDYFYMDKANTSIIYCGLSDENDLQYVEIEKEHGYDIHINVKEEGIYTIIFDITKGEFDLIRKGDITTPVYETIESCDLYTLKSKFVQMTQNPNNAEELYANITIDRDALLSFFSHNIHTSNYKIKIDPTQLNKYADQTLKTSIEVRVGGNYDVFININSYYIRFELKNKTTADYYCQYAKYNKETKTTEWIQLTAEDSNKPYLLTTNYAVADIYTTTESFYNHGLGKYNLELLNKESFRHTTSERNGISYEYYWFKTAGNYKVTVDLDAFTVKYELIPE